MTSSTRQLQSKAAAPASLPSARDGLRSRRSTGSCELNVAPPLVHDVLRSPGQPLDASTRSFMEPRFGHDFSRVRVHTDARAAESARAVGALAYTVGRDVAFNAGQYSPQTNDGQRLLAHELTHVVQQGRGGATPVSQASDALEQDAAQAATVFTQGNSPITVAGSSAPGLARQPLSDEEKIQQALGIKPQSQPKPPKIIWLGQPPSAELQDAAEKGAEAMREGKPIVLTPKTAPGAAELKENLVKQGVLPPAALAPEPARPKESMASLLPEPRTTFVEQAFRRNLLRIHHPETGVIIGFFAEESGIYCVYDYEGKRTTVGEKGLGKPLLDPLDFIPFELLASLTATAARVAGRTALRAVTRAVGKEVAVEGAELITKTAARDLSAAAERKIVSRSAAEADELASLQRTLRQEGTLGPLRAEGELPLGSQGRTLQNRAGDFKRTPTPAGAEERILSQGEYEAALRHVFPGQYSNQVASAVDSIGQGAARRAMDNPRFVQAIQDKDWTLAGTLFHSAAAQEARAFPASVLPSGWTMQAERVIQSGAGGSRADILLQGPAGQVVEFDWKTTGRSALSTSSRNQMTRHAGQINTNVSGNLTIQESRSWIDYVRPLLSGAQRL